MKINKTLINIDTIYDDCTISEIWAMLNTLIEVSYELEADKDYHLENPYNGFDITKKIQSINEQLYYVKANIKTLRLALTAYEHEVSSSYFNPQILAPIYWN
jgi:hypothetical protein